MGDNPINFNDPTGHRACGDGEEYDCDGNLSNPRLITKGEGCSGSSCLGNATSDNASPITSTTLTSPIVSAPACFNDGINRIYVGKNISSSGNLLGSCTGDGSTSINSGSGLYPSDEAIIGGSNAFVEYWAQYNAIRYENMTKLTISEKYYFSGSMPIWSPSSGAVFLNVEITGGLSTIIRLGDLEHSSVPLPFVTRDYLSRSTDIYFYDNNHQPENISIKIYFSTETNVFSADYYFPDYILP